MRPNKTMCIILAVLLSLSIAIPATSCDFAGLGSTSEPPASAVSPPPSSTQTDASPGDDSTPPSDASPSPEASPPEASPPPDTSPPPSVDPPPPLYPGPDVKLVPYDGTVEHIFFHEVIAFPELAFDGDSGEKGYDDSMVTAYEYKKILDSLYANNYILVNMNDVWSEYTNNNGEQRMRKNTLMLPEGKKPIIISFDDLSFYQYMQYDGFMQKLIIGEDGEIWASGFDPQGNPVITQDLAVVPILDKFIKEHPDFSMNGAKGCIALTGYEGILGYRTQYDAKKDSEEFRLNRAQEIARVRPIVDKLKETGWYFASHSYGHLGIDNISLDSLKTDAMRWMDEVSSLIGETQIFIYPFGARLDGNDVWATGPGLLFYISLGFRMFASVGYEPFTFIKSDIPAIMCDRMNVDGIAMRGSRLGYIRFYDAMEVFDPMRPAKYGNTW